MQLNIWVLELRRHIQARDLNQDIVCISAVWKTSNLDETIKQRSGEKEERRTTHRNTANRLGSRGWMRRRLRSSSQIPSGTFLYSHETCAPTLYPSWCLTLSTVPGHHPWLPPTGVSNISVSIPTAMYSSGQCRFLPGSLQQPPTPSSLTILAPDHLFPDVPEISF